MDRQRQGFLHTIPTTSSEQQDGCLWRLIFETAQALEVTLRLLPRYLLLINLPQLLLCLYLYAFPCLAQEKCFQRGAIMTLAFCFCSALFADAFATNLYKNTIPHTPAYREPPLSAGWRRPGDGTCQLQKILPAIFSICHLLKSPTVQTWKRRGVKGTWASKFAL